MDWTTIFSLLRFAPKIKQWIDVGAPIVAELQKEKPSLIPVLEQAGKHFFPELTTQITAVAAAADAIFDPHGNMWTQTKLNELRVAGVIGFEPPLAVDGDYGPLTKAAVKVFQTKFKATGAYTGKIDGWNGPLTEAVILTELAKLIPAT